MSNNNNPKIKVYFDVLGNQYINKSTASYLGVVCDSDYYILSNQELEKLIDNFDIDYSLIQLVDEEENTDLPELLVYFDDEHNFLDKKTALSLGLTCESEYYLLSDKDLRDLYSKYHLKYKLYEGKKEEIKETLNLYVDEDNTVYIDKEFASLLGIETDIHYVELGKGTIEVAKKYYNVVFRDLYTKEELSEDVINNVESNNIKPNKLSYEIQ